MKEPLEKVYDPNSDTFNSYYKYEIDQKYKEIRDSIGKYKPVSTEEIISCTSMIFSCSFLLSVQLVISNKSNAKNFLEPAPKINKNR